MPCSCIAMVKASEPSGRVAAWSWLAALGVAMIAGCATHVPAPVSERPIPGRALPPAVASKPAPATTSQPDAAVVVKPLTAGDGPTYTVKPGDTLFSIAKSNNVPLRELAAWNNLEDSTSISVGQQLRLTPPDGVAVMPVKPPGTVEARPIGAPDGAPAPAAASGDIKSQPLGQRVLYSEQAYAQMAKGTGTIAAAPAANAEVKPDGKAEPKPETKAETKPAAPRAAGAVNWLWPVEGKVVENFNGSSSKGIAIAGKRGQPVHATAAGRVILSGTGIRGLGKMVVIKHNNDYLSVYAHNDKLLVKEGQNVTQGQRIAEMGNSDADQIKLHFEIRRQGKPVDPVKLLPEM